MSGWLAGEPQAAVWLVRCLVAMAAVLAASTGFLLVHHALSVRREVRRRRRLELAAEELAPCLAGRRAGASAAVRRACRRWGRRAVATVLRRTRRCLVGERERALSALLEEIGEPHRLARAARRGGTLARARALSRLGACGGDVARRELLRAAADRRPALRRVAQQALLELRDPFAVSAAVAAFLAEPSPSASCCRSFLLRLAVWAPAELRRLAGEPGPPAVLRKLAMEALAESGDREAAPLAEAELGSPAGDMRAAAVRLLGATGDRRWTTMLAGCLTDREWYVRAAAARALGSLPPAEAAVAALGESLDDPHWWVRANAARGLGRLGRCGMERLARAAAGGGEARQAAMPELLRLDEAREGAEAGAPAARGLALAS